MELSWKEFQECFLKRYFSTSECEKRKLEFLYLKQGDQTVIQYARQFHKLSHFAKSLVSIEKDSVERFLHGLRLTIQKDLVLFEPKNHAEALDKALRLERFQDQMGKERKLKEKKRSYDQEKVQKQNKRHKLTKLDQNPQPQQKVKCSRCGRNHHIKDCFLMKGICFQCKKPGHVVANCPEKKDTCPQCGRPHKLKDCLVAKGACFYCKQPGHKAAECPKKIT